MRDDARLHVAPEPDELARLLLELGVALAMTGDAVSQIQTRLRAIATAQGHANARISVLPTLLLVAVAGEPASVRPIDSLRQLRLDQATAVIRLAQAAEAGAMGPDDARDRLREILAMPPRFATAWYIAAHGILTLGLALVIRPAAVDLWVYVLLGCFVGGLKAWGRRFATGGYLLAIVAAASVSAVAFLAHGGDEAASLRLTIPPLVTFLPGALLTMAVVDLAMGETITGASRFVAGLLQMTLLAIGIVVGAQLVGNPHSAPGAGGATDALGAWSPWVGVVIFGLGVFVHDSAPRGALPWLLVVLMTAWIGQLVGANVIDSSLSGFIGAAAMVPVAHAVAHVPAAPPAHVMFLPAFWLLVPGTIGLIGITELVGGTHADTGSEHFVTALSATASVALGILVGTMIVRAVAVARARIA